MIESCSVMRFLLVAADKSSKIPIEVPSELITKSLKRASKVSKVKVEKRGIKKQTRKVKQIARAIAK